MGFFRKGPKYETDIYVASDQKEEEEDFDFFLLFFFNFGWPFGA